MNTTHNMVNKDCFGKLLVTSIGFEINRIRHIKPLAFQNQSITESINLDGNQLEYLSPSSFVGLKKLKHISVLRNNLRGIEKYFFAEMPMVKINIDNVLLCCVYKAQNMWCNFEENNNIPCLENGNPAYWPLGLVLGCTELTISVTIYAIYLRRCVAKLIKATSYTTSLVGMYINQVLYGLSLILTDIHVVQVAKGHYILLTESLTLQYHSAIYPFRCRNSI